MRFQLELLNYLFWRNKWTSKSLPKYGTGSNMSLHLLLLLHEYLDSRYLENVRIRDLRVLFNINNLAGVDAELPVSSCL